MSHPFSHEENHLKVLRLLEANPHMSQRELSDVLGVSLGKVNYCLKALLGKGLIKIQNFRHSDKKLAYAYFLTPGGLIEKAELTARFLKRKLHEYECLTAEIALLTQEVAHQNRDTSIVDAAPLDSDLLKPDLLK